MLTEDYSKWIIKQMNDCSNPSFATYDREYDDSQRCYDSALSMNPYNSNVHAGLGLLYHIHGDHSKAIFQYNLVSHREEVRSNMLTKLFTSIQALRNSTTQDLVVGLLEKALLSNASTSLPSKTHTMPENDDDFDIFKPPPGLFGPSVV